MKIILIKDVKGVGKIGDVVETSDGHALNYLIPKKLAISATKTAIKDAESRRKQDVDQHALNHALLAQNIASLAEASIIIKVKANEKGHLYDAIGVTEISAAVKEQCNIDLPKEAITLERPIKELGTFDIPISINNMFGRFSITIESEDEE